MPESQSPQEISGIRQKAATFFWRPHRMHYLFLILIVLLGAGLRLINIQAEPYWGDEVLSLDIATYVHPIGQLLDYIRAVEFHPPLYYIILQTWTHWFGVEPGATRSLSLIFGVAIIVLTYVFTRKLWDDSRAALIVALILAVLPIQVEFGQEARPYTLVAFLGLVASYALWQYLRTRTWWTLGLYILACVLGFYTHYSFVFILCTLGLWWGIEIFLLNEKVVFRDVIWWLAAETAIIVAISFFLEALIYKTLLGTFSIAGLMRNEFFVRPLSFFNMMFDQLIWLTKHENVERIPIFAVFITKITLIGLFVRWLHDGGWARVSHRARSIAFLLVLIGVPAVLYFFSPQSVPYTTIPWRHVFFVTIPIVILLAGLVTQLPTKHALVAFILFLISLIPFTADILDNDAEWDYDFNLEAVSRHIAGSYRPEDLVIVPVTSLRTDVTHYLPDIIPVTSLLPIQYDGKFDIYNSRHTLGLIENEYQTRFVSPSPAEVSQKFSQILSTYHPKRIWLVFFSNKDHLVHLWLLEHGWRQAFRAIGDVYRLDLYARDASAK